MLPSVREELVSIFSFSPSTDYYYCLCSCQPLWNLLQVTLVCVDDPYPHIWHIDDLFILQFSSTHPHVVVLWQV